MELSKRTETGGRNKPINRIRLSVLLISIECFAYSPCRDMYSGPFCLFVFTKEDSASGAYHTQI